MTELPANLSHIGLMMGSDSELTSFDCAHPNSVGDYPDFVLGMICTRHPRSVYYCRDLDVLWCDGGGDAWPWHEFALLALRPEDRDQS
jgi:hypothetical protein